MPVHNFMTICFFVLKQFRILLVMPRCEKYYNGIGTRTPPHSAYSESSADSITTTLFYGTTDTLFWRPQSIQNTAARLATGTRRFEHIRRHWLSVCKRVDFKLATLVNQALHDLLPSYLSDDCQLVTGTGRRQQSSSTTNTCFVPH